MKMLFSCLASLMLAMTVGQVQAGFVLDANNDFRVRNVFGSPTVNDDASLEVFNNGSFVTHSVIEFDISLLAGETISAVTLELTPHPTYPSSIQDIDVNGFVGNGANDIADATAGSLLGSFTFVNSLNSVSISTTFLQGLVDNGDGFAGFSLAPQAALSLSTFFGTLNEGVSARLVVETSSAAPVPEPTSIAMWSMMGGIGIMVRRKRKKA